jgi:hypothetical protein
MREHHLLAGVLTLLATCSCDIRPEDAPLEQTSSDARNFSGWGDRPPGSSSDLPASSRPIPSLSTADLQKRIVGKWEDDQGMITEFFPDGQMTLTHPTEKIEGLATLEGTWKVGPGSRLEVTIKTSSRSDTVSGSLLFESADLAIMEGDHDKSVMHRIKESDPSP